MASKYGEIAMNEQLTELQEQLLTEILSKCKTKEDIVGKNGLIQNIMKRALQSALDAELEEHLGYKKHAVEGKNSGNNRNGIMKKNLKGEFGDIELETPRDRNGSFEPQIVQKNQTRFDGFDSKIVALYAKGMTTRDIQETLKELYSVDVSHSLISRVTDGLIDDIKHWQNRKLDNTYAVSYLDCIVVKVKENHQVINKSIYLVLGINMEGRKELLGMWIAQNEGAKFWLSVVTELKSRGVEEIFIACVDGLKGFPEAIQTIYPKTQIQSCIVHQVRSSLKYVPSKDKKEVAADLKLIYSAATVIQAEQELTNFEAKWDNKYPSISRSWRNNWNNLITMFAYPEDIRKVIYTTNAIESLNMVIRKATNNRRSFPCDEAAFKVVFLAVQGASKKWTMPIKNWGQALNYFHIKFIEKC